MEFSENHGSNIIKFYEGKTIFLTGSTGFLGRMILEKLLRICEDFNKIYILVRPKKGKETKSRVEELFEGAEMESMKKQNPNYKNQVCLIKGDLLQPMCGLTEESIQTMKNEVDIIIHCAATVRFDQVIRNATYINLRGLRDLMEIARGMKKLKVFMYVSTAYSFCPRKEIDEAFYHPPIRPNELITLMELLDDERLNSITPTLLGKWPNTYAFTKAVAEGLIAEEGCDLPMVVVRPSIVISALKEPSPGWTNNIYGPAAVGLATFSGFMRCVLGGKDNNADMVPADYVVNIILAALYDRSEKRKRGSLYNQKIIPIYNYCVTPFTPITWGEFLDMTFPIGLNVAPSRAIYYPTIAIRKCIYHHNIAFFFQQTIPAYIADAVLYLMGKERIAITMTGKIRQLSDILGYFTLREWEFGTSNTDQLWEDLGTEDRKHFYFDLHNFDWQSYLEIYVAGLRIYLFKESVETIPAGRRKMKLFYIVHTVIKTFLYAMLLGIIYYIFRLFF